MSQLICIGNNMEGFLYYDSRLVSQTEYQLMFLVVL